MRVLVVGSGGREHALAWRLAESPSVGEVLVSPGNAGIEADPRLTVVPAASSAATIRDLDVDLVIIGPEAPLVAGLADELRDQGLDVVGPSRAAARLEGSKAFAKDFMRTHSIRTADYRVCRTAEEARQAVKAFGVPVVIKADGLAAGKGVSVCESEKQAAAAIETIMTERLFGEAGETVVVERCLSGFEASVIVMLDESGYVTLPTAEDHKQIGEGGVGANTGGMGAVAPNPRITDAVRTRIERDIVEPSVEAVRGMDALFRGFLFIGLMIDGDQARVLEYNVRFGDPEAQAILPLVDGDFGVLVRGLAQGRLDEALRESSFGVRDGASCAVVAASAGYPGPYSSGVHIASEPVPSKSALADHSHIYYAGVAADDDGLKTSGGRVLATVARGSTIDEARWRAYERMRLVSFDGMQYRRDIGGSALSSHIIEETDVLMAQFRKRGGLLPVVVQEVGDGEVLMVGYADRTALEATRRTGKATFWSTSRGELWTKGETSGNVLYVEEVRVDCDQDALLYRVRLDGEGVCHTKDAAGRPRRSCFYRTVGRDGLLTRRDS